LAIELRRFGLPVRLIDKATYLAAHSQALVVQARTLEQFQRYGLAQTAIARGRKLTRATFVSDGKVILSIPLERIPSRYPYVLFLPQSETEQILNAHMESLGVQAERGVELISLLNRGDSVAARLRHSDGREESLEARWVVGCDGAHSTVRTALGIPFQGDAIGLSFFLGDLEVEGPDAPGDELSVHVHAGNLVFMGRLTDKLTRLIVALHDQQPGQNQQAPQDDPHRGPAGPDQTLTLADFQQAIDRTGVRVKAKSSAWMTPFHVSDRQSRHYRLGAAFLAGDAAHIHSPVGGQGMNTGIQDVANLAWKLAAVAHGADSTLLDSYEEERGAVGRALLRFTSRGLGLATSANPLLNRLRDALMPQLSRLPGVQDRLLGFVSEIAIAYRDSSSVLDIGGDGTLRAGDRMPDLTLTPNPTRSAGDPTLLSGWHAPGHLALVLQGDDLRAPSTVLPQVETLTLTLADLDDDAKKLLGRQSKLILIRPDGYVGFRSRAEESAQLASYVRRVALA
jgi:2-polyprenyl-6-methoxyphenol hydroxylase-like FAD-dependent oxidoreductase